MKDKLYRYYRLLRICYKRNRNTFQLFIFLICFGLILLSFLSCFMDTEKDKEMRKPSDIYAYTR
jgi:hypothetical protein